MSQKRGMSQMSQGRAKRARTVDTELTKLKKQVSRNKPELKYYDGYLRSYADALPVDNQSFFTDVFEADGITADTPIFVGRKTYVRKIEIRLNLPANTDSFLMWREKRQGKDVSLVSRWPLALDPEYHTHLRHHEQIQDTDVQVKYFTIDFGMQGRLVEFDDQETAIASGDIVSGDIKTNVQVNNPQNVTPLSFRLWYHDG